MQIASTPTPACPPPDPAWPRIPGLRCAADEWEPATGPLLDRAGFDRLTSVIESALPHVGAPSITITRSSSEVLNLLGGAPRLRTIHDTGYKDPSTPLGRQQAMRRYNEMVKGIYAGGSTAYGVLVLREAGTPAPVLDAYGGVALTLTPSAMRRATFLATDAFMTAQRPARFADLAGVIAERVARDAQLADGEDLLPFGDGPADRPRGRNDIAAAIDGAPDALDRIRRRIGSEEFGRGHRYIEAQVSKVTIDDIARIDISSTAVSEAEQTRIAELARAAGIPVAVS